MPFLVALLILPLVEIAGFVLVGRMIGVWGVIGLVLLAVVVGMAVIRQTGEATAGRLRRAGRGDLLSAAMPVADGALRLLAGLLLIVPGFLTDLVALALLIPPVRRLLIALLAARVVVARTGRQDPTIIDGEFIDLDDERLPPPRSGPPSDWTRH